MTNTPSSFDAAQAPLLATRTAAVPGVAHLDGGTFGEFSTYLPTELVKGIAYDAASARLKVAIAIHWPHPPHEVADAVRSALAQAVTDPIDIYVNDIVTAPPPTASPSSPTLPAHPKEN